MTGSSLPALVCRLDSSFDNGPVTKAPMASRRALVLLGCAESSLLLFIFVSRFDERKNRVGPVLQGVAAICVGIVFFWEEVE